MTTDPEMPTPLPLLQLTAGMRVVVPLAPITTAYAGQLPAVTTATVLEQAHRHSATMWWLDVDLAHGGRLCQMYEPTEVLGLWVGPT